MKRLFFIMALLIVSGNTMAIEKQNETNETVVCTKEGEMESDGKSLTRGQIGARFATLAGEKETPVIKFLETGKEAEGEELDIDGVMTTEYYIGQGIGLSAFCEKEIDAIKESKLLFNDKLQVITADLAFTNGNTMSIQAGATSEKGIIIGEFPVEISVCADEAERDSNSLTIIIRKGITAKLEGGKVIALRSGSVLQLMRRQSDEYSSRRDDSWTYGRHYQYVSTGIPVKEVKTGDKVVCIRRTELRAVPESDPEEGKFIDAGSLLKVFGSEPEWIETKWGNDWKWVKKEDVSLVFGVR